MHIVFYILFDKYRLPYALEKTSRLEIMAWLIEIL